MHYLHWWIRPPGVIDVTLPSTNSYVDEEHITCYEASTIPKSTLAKHIGFLREHYQNSELCKFAPTEKHYLPYFSGHNSSALMAQYCETNTAYGKDGAYSLDDVRGLITGRPTFICENGKRRPAYYVDYLCVHKGHRKKDIATKLISTYFYKQRHMTPEVKVYLFKREGVLLNIVPLCTFPSCLLSGISISSIASSLAKRNPRSKQMRATRISTDRWHVVEEAIGVLCRGDGCVIVSSPGNLRSLAESANILAMTVHVGGGGLGVFLYKDLACKVRGKRVLSCVCAIPTVHSEPSLFAAACAEASDTLMKEGEYEALCIDLVGSYREIFGYWENTGFAAEVSVRSPTAYYLYNYGKRPMNAKDVTIIL